MSLIESLLAFFLVILSYFLIVFILHKKEVLKKHHISFNGPFLMWRTKKGISFLQRVAKKNRFWHAFGSFGIVFCFVAMIVMVVLFIWNTWAILGFTPDQIQSLPGIEFMLILPGINPLFPLEYLGYIIVAFVIAIIAHEFAHGILTFAGKLKVKSLGLLYLIVPLGAFCEPDEEQLKSTHRGNRMRIFAAGPTMNFVVVLVSMVLFSMVFMSAVQPAADGVRVLSVDENSPAEQIGLRPGVTITYFNDSRIIDATDYFNNWNNTYANQTVNISYVIAESSYSTSVTLLDMYTEFTRRGYVINESYKGKGYLGVTLLRNNVYEFYLASLKNPFIDFPNGFGFFYVLPLFGYFQGFNPIVAPFTDTFIITGPLGALPTPVFWVIVNAIYWIFWLNFAVAIFNILPAVPLDGGYLFKDAVAGLVKKLRKQATPEQQEKLVSHISLTISLVILFFILFPFILKYLAPFL